MPRCVHSAAKTTFPFEVLLFCPAVLACCAWVWFVAAAAAAACGATLLQRYGEAFNFSGYRMITVLWLSTHVSM